MLLWVVGAVVVAAVVWRAKYMRDLTRLTLSRRVLGADGIVVGGEGFVLERAEAPAVLLLHGGGDTPQTLRYLATALHARGFHVDAPLLPGHGRTVRDFARVTANQLIDATKEAKDTLGGMNVQALALQIPKSKLVKKGHPTIGMYAETERQSFSNELTGAGRGSWVQIERLGNPLVNEVLIPLGQKDHWNHVDPAADGQFDSFFKAPQLAAALGDTHTPRNDILAILETGLPGLNFTGKVHADMLRLNTSIEPTAMGHESPLGVLGADNAGFPNGRRPLDDVTDIELRALAGATDTPAIPNSASDGVQRNDESFEITFPYLAIANSGTAGIHQMPTP